MPLEPLQSEKATEFTGLKTNADPRDIGAGAAVTQTNVGCFQPGAIQVRGGIRPGTFSNGIASVSTQVMGLFFYRHPVADWVVFQGADGKVRVGKGFA